MKNFDEDEVSRELESLKNLQVSFDGHEANALILAVQALHGSSLNCEELAPLLYAAKIAALKLQRLFVHCPATFSAIEHGWHLISGKNFPPETSPLEGFES
ncbi:hypothetical protein D0A34_23660 [Microcoleus vaginatus PCC 9802]|uniref:hypothetical protein n=1 Tax=Microcoleus vaginatus TaxID=119532 RepID=UPI00020D10A0|nr:hypothetical protein MicvaDRAFT_1753 [Microcoleus vaginatus FGP-2]UNU21443.1 hypothetical protein D0A34_23660 [Microcoleus vaginatus PCC 9802]